MKKILFTSIFTLSILVLKAQDTTTAYDHIFFTNLFAKGGLGSSNEQPNYHLSNTNFGFGGQWGLDIKWFGGVKLRSAGGLLYLSQNGNVGIGKEPILEKLDIDGGIAATGNITGNDIISGGSNGWKFHTPDDGRSTMYIAPLLPNGNGDWDISTEFRGGNIAVKGKLEAREVKVTQSPTADFVFDNNYGLPKLEVVESYIKEHKHLPEIASAKEMEKDGVSIGEFQIKLLQKIEELTLYSIEQNKQIKKQVEENKHQQEKINLLESENKQFKTLFDRVEKLEKQDKTINQKKSSNE